MRTEQNGDGSCVKICGFFTQESRTVQRHRVYWTASKASIFFYKEEVQRITPTSLMQEPVDEHQNRVKIISCFHSCGGLSEIS